MKKFLAIMLVLVMVLALAACKKPNVDPNTTKEPEQPSGELAGTYDVTIWCADAAQDLFKKQIDDFNKTNTDGIVINAKIQPVSEADAGTNMITDVAAGADIYCFAQDQFARLVQANALDKLGVKAADAVRAANDAGVVAAATAGEDLYAYPMTSDNGYFMYYDKSIIPDEDIDSLEKLIADCEAKQKYFAFDCANGWYVAGWFFGTGCVSEWKTDADGQFVDVNDNWNSDKGLIAVKGLEKLVKSDFHVNSAKVAEFESNAAVVVSGTWDYEAAKGLLGDNLGVADLPSFTVDGQEYHIGSFNGCKLLGVKPQTDAKKGAAIHKLAAYLTGEKCQQERFETLSWGPSNTAVQGSDAVKQNPGLAALLAQAPYSKPQGQIPDAWWGVAGTIAAEVKEANGEEALKAVIQNYENKCKALFDLFGSQDYIFVGAWGGWDNSSTDYKLTEVDGKLTITIEVPQSDYMGGRIVPIGTWDTTLGYAQVTEGADLLNADAAGDDNNIVFAEAGNYTVTVDLDAMTITIVKN
ncbi:MAG: extracellular solute-binding protein [Clostridiales bacterium]|nr:extracellular solute-binding protein [Clostridiales bacterium]